MESMNQANKAARDRTAVDVVCATKLLLSLSSKRYHEKKEMAWKWQNNSKMYPCLHLVLQKKTTFEFG
jgi:hypothetical protein